MPKELTINAVVNKLVDRINTDTRRLRLLEQKADILSDRLDRAEQAVLSAQGAAKKSAAELGARLDSQGKLIQQMEDALKEVIDQLKQCPTRADLKELESLVDLYNPLKSSFITRQEAEQLLAKK